MTSSIITCHATRDQNATSWLLFLAQPESSLYAWHLLCSGGLMMESPTVEISRGLEALRLAGQVEG